MNSICIVCDNKKNSMYAGKNNYQVLRCASCGTLFLHPLPKSDEAKSVYGKDYFTGAEKGHGYVNYEIDKEPIRPVFDGHLLRLEKMLGRAGNLLDVGAATGYFMQIAEKRGWRTEGIDISEYASGVAKQKGLRVNQGKIGEVTLAADFYDVVTMWDVIEHVENPKKDLLEVSRVLKKGGYVALNTPNSGSLYAKIMGKRWHLFVPPEHIWYFNPRSMNMLLTKNGFEVVEIGCVGKKFTLEYIVSFLYRWQKLSLWNRLANWLKGSRFGKIYLPINFRDNMYVLARKK